MLKKLLKYFLNSKKLAPKMTDALRNKPIVVIYGCTGTGKTKLSIELAKKFKAEIINADAMQLYDGLPIITNKATKTEMQDVPHHLIGFLNPLKKDYKVVEYKKDAIKKIDALLEENKLPIIVGGTNYYIESIIWDIIIDDPEEVSSKKRKSIDSFYEEHMQNIYKLYDSALSNEIIHEQLARVDEISAKKIHPNDRRKICRLPLKRALEIYYQHGITKTELLNEKNKELGLNSHHGVLRYKNVIIFLLNCNFDVLGPRLDSRVDDMMKNGLLNEILEFYSTIKGQLNGLSIAEYSSQFQHGIFQSIGFKEFDDYLRENTKSEKQFQTSVEEMKANTRRYAKKQLRWVISRFIKRANEQTPDVYELDATDLDKWYDNVFNKAQEILLSRMDNRECLFKPLEKQIDENKVVFEHNFCESCNKTFVNKQQWTEHINGRSHRRRIEGLNKKFKTEKKVKKTKKEIEENSDTDINKVLN